MVDPSFQPGISFGYGKFYIELWGNASLLSDYKEFDMFLGFEHKNLTITLYDVFCGVGSEFNTKFFDGDKHSLTATIDYTFFDRLNIHWATTFIHSADFITKGKRAGKRAFSSYFEVAYTQPFGNIMDMTLRAGASPWTGPFWCPTRVGDEFDWDNPAEGFNVTNLSVTLSHEFERGDLCFPVELSYIYNPTSKYHYAVFKAGFNFYRIAVRRFAGLSTHAGRPRFRWPEEHFFVIFCQTTKISGRACSFRIIIYIFVSGNFVLYKPEVR